MRGTRRSTGLGLADQALSSLTNFVLGFLVARSVSPAELGAFGMVFGLYTFALGVCRGLASEPLVVRFSASGRTEWRTAIRDATGAVILFSTLVGIGSIAIGCLARGTLGFGLIALGLGLPGLLLQDTWRYALFAGRQGIAAFLNDLAWAVALLPSLVFVLLTGQASIFWLTFAWAGAATIAAGLGIAQAATMPNPLRASVWWREQRDLAFRYVAESVGVNGAEMLLLYSIAAVAGLSAVGAIKAAGLLFGPLNVAFMAVGLSVVPELVRIARSSPGRAGRICAAVSTALTALAASAGLALLLVPDRFGRFLLGPSWTSATTVLLPLTVLMAGSGASNGVILGLRALAAARRSLRARLLSSGLLIVGAILGAFAGQAVGAAWGLAIARWLGVVLLAVELRPAIREYQPAGENRTPATLATG